MAEGDLASVVEGEELEKVLEVYDLAGDGSRGEERKETRDGLEMDAREDEGTDSFGGELETGSLALETPVVAVGVEDAGAEEVMEDGGEGGAFWVVVEVGLEDVLNVGRVGGDDGHEG